MEPSSRQRVPISILYAAYAAMLLWAGLYVVPYTLDIVRIVATPEKVAGVPFIAKWPDQVVYQTSTAAILKKDRVVSLDGAQYRQRPDLEQRVRSKGPGSSLDVVVERGDAAIVTPVRVELRQLPAQPMAFAIRLVALDVIMPLLCFALGFWVTLARPRDPVAWLVLFMLLGLSQIGERLEVHPGWPDALRIPGTVYRAFFFNTWMIWFPLFGLYFAERLPWDRERPWIAWLLLGPLAIFALRNVIVAVARSVDARGIVPFQTATEFIPGLQFGLAMAAVGG